MVKYKNDGQVWEWWSSMKMMVKYENDDEHQRDDNSADCADDARVPSHAVKTNERRIMRFHDDARVLGFDLFHYRITVYVYNTNQYQSVA